MIKAKGSYKGDSATITKSHKNLIIQVNLDHTGSVFLIPLKELRELLK